MRPIIKEEELMRMDSLADDDDWAHSDEIDYNKKLAFSDDENESNGKDSVPVKQDKKLQHHQQQQRDDQRRQEEESRNGKCLFYIVFFLTKVVCPMSTILCAKHTT